MKKIMMMLAVTLIAYGSAEAQICNTTPKHKKVVKHKTVRTKTQTTARESAMCKMVPYQVCTILPGRRSVSCYATMDLENLSPMNNETTYYGSTGSIPGQAREMESGIKTIVVKGEGIKDHCRQSTTENGTVCFQSGTLLRRDRDGYYYYLTPVRLGANGQRNDNAVQGSSAAVTCDKMPNSNDCH